MLVFVIPTSYPNPDNPVANSFVKEQVEALSQHGNCQVVVLNVQKQSTKKIFKKVDYKINFVEDKASKIVRTKCKTFFEKSFIFLNMQIFMRSLQRLYKTAIDTYGKPDIIYAHFYSAGYAAMHIVADSKIPVVVMEHSGNLMKPRMNFRETNLLKYVVSNADRYIATTSRLREMVIKHTQTAKKIDIIPNIVDDSFAFKPLPESNTFTFLSVSRLEYDKRVDLLIRAFCKAFKNDEKVSLRIGGIGSEFNHLQGLIETENRQKQIKLIGVLDRKSVPIEMEKCACFVLPSRHETFGLVWREALCVGRPVITTDHGGFSKNDWKDDFGIMIPVDDESALVNALRNVRESYNNYDLKYISQANRNVYSSKVIGDMVYDLLTDEIKEQ